MSELDGKKIRVECDRCGSVEATVLGSQMLAGHDFEPQGTALVECPQCQQPLVAQHWYYEDGISPDGTIVGNWTPFKRAWPAPDRVIPHDLPDGVGESLREAQKCLGASAFIACAAMCGRALEALCRDHNANDKMLGAGLKELRTAGQIDERLYEWGRELNKKRNIAAHPDPTPISKTDAEYVFDFALAICDYVYVLTAKFERFKAGK
jgi:hypothetical protein